LAAASAQIPGLAADSSEANLVYFDPTEAGLTAAEFAAWLRQRGALISVLHLDVDRVGVDLALACMRDVVATAA
jgi:hypothetical protein